MARVPDLSGNGVLGSAVDERTALHDSSPMYNDAQAVTPSDTVDLPNYSRSLYVGGLGDLTIITRAGNTVTFPAVPAGTLLTIEAKRVMATATTATNIKALY